MAALFFSQGGLFYSVRSTTLLFSFLIRSLLDKIYAGICVYIGLYLCKARRKKRTPVTVFQQLSRETVYDVLVLRTVIWNSLNRDQNHGFKFTPCKALSPSVGSKAYNQERSPRSSCFCSACHSYVRALRTWVTTRALRYSSQLFKK